MSCGKSKPGETPQNGTLVEFEEACGLPAESEVYFNCGRAINRAVETFSTA
jgi:hypothetical protein